MKADELRSFSIPELEGRIGQWREELFRSRFKGETSEAKDTSVVPKLRHDIARALTVLNEKRSSAAPQDKAVTKAAPQDKAVTKDEGVESNG